ncbi:MAG: hypothetical protein NVS1B11_24000 [Terriglobales bacterium]
MIISVVLLLIAALALIFLVRMAKGRGVCGPVSLEEPALQIRPVDVDAFRNLMDPDEERFLRENLQKSDFRIIQRERLRAAIEYVGCTAWNAAILLRVGEAARASADPVFAQAGEKLVEDALRLRLYAFQAIARLYVGVFFPWTHLSLLGIPERYDRITRLAVVLRCFSRTAASAVS